MDTLLIMKSKNLWKTLYIAFLLIISTIPSYSILDYYHAVETLTLNTPDAPAARTFVSADFSGSSDSHDSSNIGLFGNGKLREYSPSLQTYQWNDPVTMGGYLRPTHEVGRATYANEGSNQGTIAEIFGENNFSRVLDSYPNGYWAVDLYFADGKHIDVSASPIDSIDFSVYEMGGNSKIFWTGIVRNESGSLVYLYDSGNMEKHVIDFTQSYAGNTGFTIDTTVSAGAQDVYGTGVNLSKFKDGSGGYLYAGKKIEGIALWDLTGYSYGGKIWEFNGPDIVNVTAKAVIPEPSSVICLLAALAGFSSSRRKLRR